MLKYAFIFDLKDAAPEDFRTYEYDGDFNLVIGSPRGKATENLVKKLIKEGFNLMTFCGAFTGEEVEHMKEVAEHKAIINYVKHLPKQQKQMNKLQSFKEYGIILEGTDQLKEMDFKAGNCNVHTYFVKDMDMAKIAAKKLVIKGVSFIELCGWFKEDMTIEIIDAINDAVPIGSAGLR